MMIIHVGLFFHMIFLTRELIVLNLFIINYTNMYCIKIAPATFLHVFLHKALYTYSGDFLFLCCHRKLLSYYVYRYSSVLACYLQQHEVNTE